MSSTSILFELSESQKRQYIDAETVYLALAQAKKAAAEVRGSMFWRDLKGTRTLIRSSASGGQKSLGAHSETTQQLFDSFMQRKTSVEARVGVGRCMAQGGSIVFEKLFGIDLVKSLLIR